MKKQLLLVLSTLFLGFQAHAANVIITNSGNNFTPTLVTINLGDTVFFNISASHNAREVSQATYIANDTISNGGFEVPYDGGFCVPTTLGDHYYVCVPHVQMHAMKGIIRVSQLSTETFKPVNLQILQSVYEQQIELKVTGGTACEMHVEMLNLGGQTVRKLNLELNGEETSNIIQVGDLPKGVYMIRWSYGNVNKAKKIILQ